jgi:hypothetical protein
MTTFQPQPCGTPGCSRLIFRSGRTLCSDCSKAAERRVAARTVALLAEMVDAMDGIQHAMVREWERTTPPQRAALEAAAKVGDRARAALGVSWPRDCVRPEPDPATSPSPE